MQELRSEVVELMPSAHMQATLQCLLALLLASRRPRPQHSQTKSAAALSRFLNRYGWPRRQQNHGHGPDADC
ncbi:hypothetical protein XM38_024360 [Halomicronema hongdechloris C2206]|uniref:Uncharacterized protein n=1 Tax=Halomicronema hongdechloris C2206 TaxID=1641165 RepID=A0A1Z3HME6_9CYAN|nr:hypothetical protein XM38_024360 [Halomicronema hongdechloris C2206]